MRAAVEAEAQKLLNEAENVLTDEARYSLFRRKLLDRIEGIVRESVKPMEKIEGIRILSVDGLNGAGGGGRRAQRDRRSDRFGVALSRPGAADRFDPVRDRRRGRQPLQDAAASSARRATCRAFARTSAPKKARRDAAAAAGDDGGSPRKKS